MTVPETRKRRSDNVRRLAAFLILFGFWLIFSGHFDRLHLSLGLICASLVAFFSHDLLILDGAAPPVLLKTWRFIHYEPWLLYQVFLANLHVVFLVIDPRELRPRIVRFNTSLRSDLAKVSLGNSITLTPGTIHHGHRGRGVLRPRGERQGGWGICSPARWSAESRTCFSNRNRNGDASLFSGRLVGHSVLGPGCACTA